MTTLNGQRTTATNTGRGSTTTSLIYPPGTEVFIGPKKDIQAHILSVSIRLHGTQYEIAWWHEGSRRTEWLEENEFTTENQKSTIGYL